MNSATETRPANDNTIARDDTSRDVSGLPVRGVFASADGFDAVTFAASKTFKTRAGADRWFARMTGR